MTINRLEIEGLRAELAELQSLLSEAADVGDPVGEYQFQQRIESVEAEIARLESEPERRAALALYFGGRPVLGSRGIVADFAARALGTFQKLVSTSFASASLGELGERGKVPLQDLSTLMVTGVAHGSFGFVLDETSDQSALFDTKLRKVVQDVLKLVADVGSANDDDFEAAALGLDQRMLIALQEFFSELDSNAATVRMVEDDFESALDRSAVGRGRLRIEATEVADDEKTLVGELIGFLPEHKTFELKLGTDEVIYGSASEKAAEQYNKTLSKGDPAIGRQCEAMVRIRKITPFNRPVRLVYRILEFVNL